MSYHASSVVGSRTFSSRLGSNGGPSVLMFQVILGLDRSSRIILLSQDGVVFAFEGILTRVTFHVSIRWVVMHGHEHNVTVLRRAQVINMSKKNG